MGLTLYMSGSMGGHKKGDTEFGRSIGLWLKFVRNLFAYFRNATVIFHIPNKMGL